MVPPIAAGDAPNAPDTVCIGEADVIGDIKVGPVSGRLMNKLAMRDGQDKKVKVASPDHVSCDNFVVHGITKVLNLCGDVVRDTKIALRDAAAAETP